MSRILDRQVTETLVTDSSCVTKASYCAANETLDITFPSGRVYRYRDVPLSEWLHLSLTGDVERSIGAYFNRYIRNRYDFIELQRKEEEDAADLYIAA